MLLYTRKKPSVKTPPLICKIRQRIYPQWSIFSIYFLNLNNTNSLFIHLHYQMIRLFKIIPLRLGIKLIKFYIFSSIIIYWQYVIQTIHNKAIAVIRKQIISPIRIPVICRFIIRFFYLIWIILVIIYHWD